MADTSKPLTRHIRDEAEFYRAVFADLDKKAKEKLKANRQALVDGHTIELNPRITIRYKPDSLQQNMMPEPCCVCYQYDGGAGVCFGSCCGVGPVPWL